MQVKILNTLFVISNKCERSRFLSSFGMTERESALLRVNSSEVVVRDLDFSFHSKQGFLQEPALSDRSVRNDRKRVGFAQVNSSEGTVRDLKI